MALSSYRSFCQQLPTRPVWAVAENYRFEPAFLEVFWFCYMLQAVFYSINLAKYTVVSDFRPENL